MFSIADYGDMIFDKVRFDAGVRSLRDAVKPGAIVIDIGTGAGIFALLACRFGARRVYAIDPNDAIQVAREIAAANGLGDRIEFIQALSTQVTLPERADVIISDLGDALPWFCGHLPAIADARRRFLGPGGILIPQRDVGWAAIVQMPELYARRTAPWDDNEFGINMEAARRIAVNTLNVGRVKLDNLLTELQRWAVIDYSNVEDADVRANITWSVTRSGTGHGIALGFDRTLSDGVHLSNAPDAPDAIRPVIYPTVFLPWQMPVALSTGDVVSVELEARLLQSDYIWNWKTRVADRTLAETDKACFTQSMFFGRVMSPATLEKRAASYVPTLSENGRIARLVLESMDSETSLGEIAGLVSTEFASRFPRDEDALTHVADLSRKYS